MKDNNNRMALEQALNEIRELMNRSSRSYISSNKRFIGRKPNTSYSITEAGRCSFSAHINALSKLLKF